MTNISVIENQGWETARTSRSYFHYQSGRFPVRAGTGIIPAILSHPELGGEIHNS